MFNVVAIGLLWVVWLLLWKTKHGGILSINILQFLILQCRDGWQGLPVKLGLGIMITIGGIAFCFLLCPYDGLVEIEVARQWVKKLIGRLRFIR